MNNNNFVKHITLRRNIFHTLHWPLLLTARMERLPPSSRKGKIHWRPTTHQFLGVNIG